MFKGGEGTAPGSIQHQELTPAPLPRCLLPGVPPPYAAIRKDRQGRAIWPRFRFPGHTRGPERGRHPVPVRAAPGGTPLPPSSQLPFPSLIPS